MKIAVCSGKGGTGKTTVATHLALLASRDGTTTTYLDCDVEEPNGAIFLKPCFTETRPVNVSVPKVNLDRCIGCGQCDKICQYSAIISINKRVLVFPELCHGCAGCWLVCPTNAISESHRETGEIQLGLTENLACVQGLLKIGEAMSPPVIAAVKKAASPSDLWIIDSPPGTSCPVIQSVRGSDYVLLVTEPTPFGLNDLKLAVDMLRAMNLSFGVAINRADLGDDQTLRYCEREGINVLAEIPDDRRVAESYSRGDMACDSIPEYRDVFLRLLKEIETNASVSTRGKAH